MIIIITKHGLHVWTQEIDGDENCEEIQDYMQQLTGGR